MICSTEDVGDFTRGGQLALTSNSFLSTRAMTIYKSNYFALFFTAHMDRTDIIWAPQQAEKVRVMTWSKTGFNQQAAFLH